MYVLVMAGEFMILAALATLWVEDCERETVRGRSWE